MPHAAILAIQGLRRRDGRTPQPGDRVLIDGASGNVGPFAIHHVRNTGIAFGLFSGATSIVIVLTCLAIGALVTFFARSGRRHPLLPLRRPLRPPRR